MLPLDLFIIRHGESEGNSALGQFRKNKKRSDFTLEFLNRHNAHYRLTDQGREQARVAGDWLKKWLEENRLSWFDHHFVSTHTRTLETAAILDLPSAEWEADFQLRERETGVWGVIPDKKWQKRHEMSMRSQRNHRFYTSMPDGESIADVCNRLRNFIGALYHECGGDQQVVIVSHGDTIQALRVIFEQILPDRYDELSKENSHDFKIGNCQIIHYTRVDPNMPQHTLPDQFGWVRSINPWNLNYAGHDWRVIQKNSYDGAELLVLVARHKRLIKE